jgi:hypothetical protein
MSTDASVLIIDFYILTTDFPFLCLLSIAHASLSTLERILYQPFTTTTTDHEPPSIARHLSLAVTQCAGTSHSGSDITRQPGGQYGTYQPRNVNSGMMAYLRAHLISSH